MKAAQLPNGRLTTCLGFGCGELIGGISGASSRRLVETALDAGFRHFDVAPSYGLGAAEDVLGDVLHQCRDQVTIATKVGIGRPMAPSMLSLARTFAKPFLRMSPIARRLVSARVAAMKPRNQFDPRYVKLSLADSLRRLRTEHIDLYLMHEIGEQDATEDLVAFLCESLRTGALGNVGTGTAKEAASKLSDRFPQLCRVRQFRWSILDPPIDPPRDTFIITHGALRWAFKPIAAWIAANGSRAQNWSDHLGQDVSDPALLADLLVAASLSENKNGIVIVSSHKSERIRRFATIASNSKLLAEGERFRELVLEFANEVSSKEEV